MMAVNVIPFALAQAIRIAARHWARTRRYRRGPKVRARR